MPCRTAPPQVFALDWLVGKSTQTPHRWPEIRELGPESDDFARLMVLAQAIITGYKDYARVGGRKDPGGLYYWILHKGEEWLRERVNFMRDTLGLETNSPLTPLLPDLTTFPPGSWAVRLTFTLRKPYLSRDDADFYILDNPVKKEWVFKVPYVAPSQWKGALRAAMRRLRGYTTWEDEVQDQQMVRLFGNVKGEDVDFSAGRLHFYPTFFDRIGLEVINPHPRATGAGDRPIYFECVPADTSGVFTLLYVPLDAGPKDEDTVKSDLKAVARGIRAMLTEYGFGAKTSSGYGVADVDEKTITINANGIVGAQDIFRQYFRGAQTM
ncbi:MAG: hypothetical protein Q9O62_10565 [Ardenticatenia bacterium]|nr:hypothetical protein [Ardenticatenia bacterium]